MWPFLFLVFFDALPAAGESPGSRHFLHPLASQVRAAVPNMYIACIYIYVVNQIIFYL